MQARRPSLLNVKDRVLSSVAAVLPEDGDSNAKRNVSEPQTNGKAQDQLRNSGDGRENFYRAPIGSHLKLYGRDLTLDAEKGVLDPLIGRDNVVERVLQVLLRRTKNNPVLIGDPGVGKTAVVEGIAQLMISPDCPKALQGCSLVAVDIGNLVAGTQYRGAFEERLQGILNDVRNASGRIILFVDEVHMLMDAGKVEGGMNAANLLKPPLARGELHCIGATTVDEYRKHVETDAAFARRLQPVLVEEPTAQETLIWLQGLRKRYEIHHGVNFTDEAIATAVTAAQRFVSDRKLPDSAIDLMDEAASRVQLKSGAEQKLSSSTLSAESLLGPSRAALDATYEKVSNVYLSCPHCGTVTPPAGSSALTVTCPKCRYKFLNIAPEKLMMGSSLFLGHADEKLKLQNEPPKYSFEAKNVEQRDFEIPQVSSDDILHVAATASGLNADKINTILSQTESLNSLLTTLKDRIIGQDDVIDAIVRTIRVGMNLAASGKRSRCITTILMQGPRGMGKKTICKEVTDFLFGTKDCFIHLDMSQFTDRTAAAKLVGAAPGFIGYGEGGALTEAVKRHPHTVVMIENVDRAHPDILSMIKEILHNATLTDGMGRKIDFRNTIFVMTTEASSARISSDGKTGAKAETSDVTSIEMPHAHLQPSGKQHSTETVAGSHSAGTLEMTFTNKDMAKGDNLPHQLLELIDSVDLQIDIHPLKPEHLIEIAKLEVLSCKDTLDECGIDLHVAPKVYDTLFLSMKKSMNGNQARRIARAELLDPIFDQLNRILSTKSSSSAQSIQVGINRDSNIVVSTSP